MYVKYLYVLCFVAVMVVLGAGAYSLYSVYGAAAPGVAQVGERSDALRNLASGLSLLVTALAIFLIHWRRADGLVVERAVTEPPSPTRGRIRRAAPPPAE